MKTKILSMGTMYVDINAKKFPYKDGLIPNTEVIGEEYEVVPGGSALNFARVCAALELEPVFIGKVGNDVMGTVLSDLVKKSGVTPAFIQSDDVQTSIGMNFLAENGSSIMTAIGSANQSLHAEEVLSKVDQYEGDFEYMYLGGCFKLKALLSSSNQIIIKARERNAKIVLDHGRVTNAVTEADKETMRAILPQVDFYLPSKDEFLKLWGVETIEEGLTKVRKISPAVIVVKDAENGAVGDNGKNIIKVPASPVSVVNSVGAGDAFNAGFIRAHSMKLSFEECIRFAGAAAAIKISRDTLPTVDMIHTFLA